MNTDDYNQIEVQIEQIDGSKFLKEGTIVTIIVNTEDSNILSVEMPQSVVLEVTSQNLVLKAIQQLMQQNLLF